MVKMCLFVPILAASLLAQAPTPQTPENPPATPNPASPPAAATPNPGQSPAQEPEPSPQANRAEPATQPASQNQQQGQPQPAVSPSRDVNFTIPSFAKNFFSDQKKIWTFPAKLATGHHLVPVLAISAVTAGLIVGVDPIEGRYFRTHASTFQSFDNTFSEHRTTAATLLIPTAIAGAGLITRHSYLAKTGLLALEAWVDVDITAEVIRNIADRERPLDIAPNGNYAKTWFKTASSPLNADGSFPSGHTAWGYAVATTIARRYPQHKWVRWAAYGLATVDFASRITDSKHFASDAVFGGILGYVIGRYVVLRQ
jgi:membrane-associated phospholipid phosphatase